MDERHVQAALSAALRDLQEAAGVARRDHARAGLDDPRDLQREQLPRQRGLEEVVDARAAAAEVAVAELDEREPRSEEHTSELQSHHDLVCRLLLEKKKNT